MRFWLIISFVGLQVVNCTKEVAGVYHVALNTESTITLSWSLNYIENMATFEVHIPVEHGWFALGFSDRGAPFPADYCILWKSLKQRETLSDAWTDDAGIVHEDKQQDCTGFRLKSHRSTTKFTFQRRFDTCDHDDYLIEEGTTHIVWALGQHALYKLPGMNITASVEQGMTRVQLLKNAHVNEMLPAHVRPFDVLVDGVNVPGEETTYWCHVHKLGDEFQKKHHIYRYESQITPSSEGLVHHMEVFHCDAPPDEDIPLYAGNCFAEERPQRTQVCKRVLAAWAMGAPAFTYPPEAGLPIGGPNFNKYVMLEVHYNNQKRKSGFVDSSGVRFHVSAKLKPMDAGVMELGLEYTDKMAIPPQQQVFPLIGYCISECTAVSLPPEGITIFGSQLHTHLTGVAVYTRHIRDGVEMLELNRDNHFSTHFQEIRRLKRPVKVLPGDALVTRCDYSTLDRPNVTNGGFQISDEMCVNYVHYYPATDLEVCKSSISDQALETYFRYMKSWEGEDIDLDDGISDKYKSIKWNKMRVQLLDDVYREAPLSMQCNMSNGDRFPGYWENAPVTPIRTPLPPPQRNCYK